MTGRLDVDALRSQFPALDRQVGGRAAVFFDGPAGSQVPQGVIDAVSHSMGHANANVHGNFVTSRESDELVAAAGEAAADLLGVDDPECVVFGPNMTSLTFALSRALARTWKPGDEVVLCDTEHDANYTPWRLAAETAGATVHSVGLRSEDSTLDVEELFALLGPRTRLVAVGCAGNALGTINPVAEIAEAAHGVGAQVFLDAVHYAPHRLIDVPAWGCDFLACSAYKFFGPHVGILWGHRELLEGLEVDKLRPASNDIPGRWMTGTANHEGIVGTGAAIGYLEAVGRAVGAGELASRRSALETAYEAVRVHEEALLIQLLDGLAARAEIRVLGITDPERFEERVATVSFLHEGYTAEAVAKHLGDRGIFTWAGDFYAVPLSSALGLGPDGMLRVGLLHYNTAQEVDRLLAALDELD